MLHAWSASTARFREDANAEDDLVRGGYRDRVVLELAQNAADAAARAGVPGRLVLALDGERLIASNTGAPLDAAGVESLSTLRASTKRDDDAGRTAGRFGVGFAAVLALTDEPQVASTTGGVRWDASLARAEVVGIDTLRAELERRGGQVPVLRLPYPSSRRPPAGATTVVELRLRDGPALELARRLLGEVDDALLLALPALEQIVVEVDGVRRVVVDEGRWHVVRRAGRADPLLLADRPVEERDRPSWSVTWARPLAGQPLPAVLHAPTPTDEPMGLPALLIGSFPLDTSRRHVAPGPLTEFLVEQAAAAYVDLVSAVPDPGGRLVLVPGPVPVGRLDGALRSAVVEALAAAPVLRTMGGAPVAPRDAVSVVGVDDGVLAALDGVLEGLVPDSPVLERLGARRLRLVDAVDLLADLDRPPTWWHDLYAALAECGPVDTEALGALPVPLADGRLVRGPRGALVPGDGLEVDTPPLGVLGLRLVHPGAAHPLLLRLGAAAATARTVLERPEVRQAVEGSQEHDDPVSVADVVLGLVQGAGLRPGELAWLAGLGLRDDAGEQSPADELVLPGSVIAGLAAPGSLGAVAPDLADRWGPDVLAAVGVLVDLTVAECHDVVLQSSDPAALEEDARADAALPAFADWVEWAADQVGPTDLPPSVRVLRGVRELDVVADDAWDRLLSRVAGDQALRSALLDPVAVDLGEGGRALVPSYTSWWLRTRALLQGRSPGEWSIAGADGLSGLYDVMDAPPGVDPAVLGAAGVRVSLDAVLVGAGGADDLLDRLADRARVVPGATLSAVYRALSLLDPQTVSPPDSVRVRPDLVVAAADVVVVDAPHHLQLRWSPPPLVVPLPWAADLAQVLDVELSSQRVRAPSLVGTERVVPAAVGRVLADAPTRWWEHEEIVIDGTDVSWWVTEDDEVHAATVDGLARGLAWVAGRWDSRLVVAAVLDARDDVTLVDDLVAETLLDGR